MGFKEKIDGKVWNIHSKSSFLDLANFVTYLTPMPIGYAIKFYKDTSMEDLACGPNNNRHYAMSVCKLALMAKAGKYPGQ